MVAVAGAAQVRLEQTGHLLLAAQEALVRLAPLLLTVSVKAEIQHQALVIIFQGEVAAADITSHQLEQQAESEAVVKQVMEGLTTLVLMEQQILAAVAALHTGRVMLVPLLTAAQAAPVSSSSNTVYLHNPFMSSVEQPLGLHLQVQPRWITW